MKQTPQLPAGFVSSVTSDNVISLAPFGGPGTGKTRMIATAPGLVGVMPLDKKTRFTLEKWVKVHPEDRSKFILPDRDFIREAQPGLDTMQPSESIKWYRKFVDDIKAAVFTMYRMKQVRTIAIDTGTVLFRNMYFAQYGRTTKIMPRDRAAVYQEFEDFINGLQEKNLVITHQMKEIYENDVATGRMGPDGYKKLGHMVDTMVEMRSRVKGKWDEDGNPTGKYECRVMQSQSAPELEGQVILKDTDIDFPSLALKIKPGSDVDAWL